MTAVMLNLDVAQRLREVAELLEHQGANRFRVLAYRHAADTLERLDRTVAEIVHTQGMEGLKQLPGVGVSLARSIHDLVMTGRLPMLDRLRGEMDAVAILASVPGIGEGLAGRLHDDLGIETLEQLEMAAHDGRLSDIEGIGPKKLRGIIESLAGRLGRMRGQERPSGLGTTRPEPSVEEILDVDREYRERAQAGDLRRIAPHRFNPTHEAWLPILHAQRGERHYQAMFSNTAHAHQMGKTHDWVLLYYDDDHGERQCTVITSQRRPLKDKRIVRGRETECEAYYKSHASMAVSRS